MTAPKHTPGPWRADSSFAHFWMVDANLGTIAHGCHEADARLISAAPDMLAALLDVLDCIVCDNPHDDPTQQTYSIRGPMRDALVSAHEAIARAEGAK